MDNAGAILDALVAADHSELLAATAALLRIDTVPTAAAGAAAPFGTGLRAALDLYLRTAQALGFATRDVDGYAGHVAYGSGAEVVGVVGHLDVVPPGPGWCFPPFGATEHAGALYARGAIDDKGPLMAVLWALHAVRASGLPLRRGVRVLVGLDEELGGPSLERYFAVEPRPTLGFTPDGVFPLVAVEHGILTFTLHAWPADRPDGDQGAEIVALTGGERASVVPVHATCLLHPHGDVAALVARIAAYARSHDGHVGAVRDAEGCVRVWAEGRAAHGSRPAAGYNAIGALALALDALALTGGRAGILVRTLARRLGTAYDGAGLGLARPDSPDAGLTVNLATVSGDEGGAQATVTVCYPPAHNADGILAAVRTTLQGSGVAVGAIREIDLPPHVMPTDGELVRTLRTVYREVVGGDDTPRTIAGATYARAAGNVVAFGPLLPGRPETAHGPDEHIRLDDLLLLTRIYARAIYALAQ